MHQNLNSWVRCVSKITDSERFQNLTRSSTARPGHDAQSVSHASPESRGQAIASEGGLKWYDMIRYDRDLIGPEKSQESRPQQLDLNIAMAAMGIQPLWHDTRFTTGMTQWTILTILMIITLHCSTWPIFSHSCFTSVICHRTRCHC